MSKRKQLWKGAFVNRDWLKSLIRDGFKRCAKEKLEVVIGGMVNDIEQYVAGEVLLNTREVMQGIREQIDNASEFMEQYAEGIAEHQISRRAQLMEREEGGDDQQESEAP